MFSIAFTDEPLEYPYDDKSIPAAPGLLILVNVLEGFSANLAIWDKKVYEAHWRRELKSLLDGSSKVALVVCHDDPAASSNLEIWPVYRDGEWARFQNHLPFYESFPPEFTVAEVSEFLKDREVVDEDGNRISEWSVALRDIEMFLYRPEVIEARSSAVGR
jgi:hypothetical protein